MAAGTPEIRATTFHYGCEQLRLGIKPEYGVEYLCAPRRTALDRILVDAARSAGADVRHGVVLSRLQIDSKGRVVGALLKDTDGHSKAVRSDIVIGADGRQSAVAALVNAGTYLNGRSASGYVYGYYEDLERHGYHWHFGEKVAAGVIPTNHGQHCVFVSVPGTAFPTTFRGNVEGAFLHVLAANSPHLSDDVSRARLVGRLRGFAGVPGHLRQSHGPGWALVGDAGYFKDPLTAHGITDALRDAELLARAILDGRPLEVYQRQRDVLSEPLFHDTEAIASFRWNLDEVKTLHSSLSASMQAECEYMAGLPAPARREPQPRSGMSDRNAALASEAC
jgi:flavin-dependent dehydrogenase